MPANQLTAPNPVNLKVISRFLAGAAIGAIVGFVCVNLALKLKLQARSLTWADDLAMWMGISFLALGLVLAFISTNRKRLARSIEGESAKLPATNSEVRTFRLQAAVLALAGALLLIPLLSLGPLARHPGYAVPAYAGVLLVFALQTAMNVMLWRSSDEFARRIILQVCAITFAIGQGAIFLWAAAERMGLFRTLTGWQTINLLMTCYLAVGCCVSLTLRRRC